MLRPIFKGVLYLEILKCQIFIYILREIRVNAMLKQNLTLSEESPEFEYVIICFWMSKKYISYFIAFKCARCCAINASQFTKIGQLFVCAYNLLESVVVFRVFI